MGILLGEGCSRIVIGIMLLVAIALIGLCVFGVIDAWKNLSPVLMPRITGNIPTNPIPLFDTDQNAYPVFIDVPTEIRPGSKFKLTIRGAAYQDFPTSVQLSFKLSTPDLRFVQSISPTISDPIKATESSWLLPSQEFEVATVNLPSSPSEFEITIFEIIQSQGNNPPEEISGNVKILVDRTPIPLGKVVQGAGSVLGLLITTFGAVLVSKNK